jgi:hypothetical protein
MTLRKTDLPKTIDLFIKQRTPEHRYTSFDYCYNYFHPDNRSKTGDMEKSCSVLGFYLASWGMLRGSSFLLEKSVKHYEKTVQYITDCDSSLWKIDTVIPMTILKRFSKLITTLKKLSVLRNISR